MIAAETDLDRQFAARMITPISLEAATNAIGVTQAKLRAAHLKYHLSMLEVLTAEQVRRYNELRSYASATPTGHTPGMHNQAK